MEESKFIKILRLLVMLFALILCASGAVVLTMDAFKNGQWPFFLVVALCIGAIILIVLNYINIFKNWKYYWNGFDE